MNFTEVVSEVISLTKRPDKILDIQRDVNAVIRQCCNVNLARDLYEDSISISSSDYIQSVDITGLTRFRSFEYIRPYGYRHPIKKLDGPLAVYDCDGNQRVNCYYVAGSNCVVSLASLVSTLLVGYFQYPPVLTNDSPDFWLLEVEPYVIIDGAASRLFSVIGDDASSKQYEARYRLGFDNAISNLKYGITHA